MTKQVFSAVIGAILFVGFFASPAGATILWNNGPMVSCSGCGPDNTAQSILEMATLGMLAVGYRHSISEGDLLADEFTVDGGVWDVTRVTVFAYQTGSPTATTIDDFRYQIWDGPPNDPASSVVFGVLTNSLTGSSWTNIYRVPDGLLADTSRPVMRVYDELTPGSLLLPPGTYWLVWQTDGSGASGPWAPPLIIPGEDTTGNALQFSLGSWNAVEDFGSNTPQGLPFMIEGSKVANFSLSTGTVNIPVVAIDGSSKRYQVEMERTPGTLDFTVTGSSKIP